jgi:hypothetical protein
LAKQALLVEGVSQPGAGVFHVGPENLVVRSLYCFFFWLLSYFCVQVTDNLLLGLVIIS